jgi:hypothetical protein
MRGELISGWPQALLYATFVQHDNDVARAAWAGIEHVHVPIVGRLLEQAGQGVAQYD